MANNLLRKLHCHRAKRYRIYFLRIINFRGFRAIEFHRGYFCSISSEFPIKWNYRITKFSVLWWIVFVGIMINIQIPDLKSTSAAKVLWQIFRQVTWFHALILDRNCMKYAMDWYSGIWLRFWARILMKVNCELALSAWQLIIEKYIYDRFGFAAFLTFI